MKLGVDVDLLDFGHEITVEGIVFEGQGRTFVAFFPDRGGPEAGPVTTRLDLTLGEWHAVLRQTDILEVPVLEKDPASPGGVRKAFIRKSQRQVEQGVSWAVFRRDEYACRYCGRNDVPLTVDHLVLWEEGGPSIEANLVSACRKCNKTRGRLPYSQWLESPYYRRVSANLPLAVVADNALLTMSLDAIPKQPIRSR